MAIAEHQESALILVRTIFIFNFIKKQNIICVKIKGEKYDPTTNTWKLLPSMHMRRSGASVCVYGK